MGVGLYSVSCGYGCGYGFGGFASLIAMVLALRAREALRSGMGGEGVFGSLPFMARSSVRLVSGDSHARVCPSGQTSCRLMRTECRFAIPGVPCNTFTAHPAAPLGSGAAFRRPVSFAPYHPPLPSLPQVCGGEKCASRLQACVKCTSAQFRGGLRRPFM